MQVVKENYVKTETRILLGLLFELELNDGCKIINKKAVGSMNQTSPAMCPLRSTFRQISPFLFYFSL